MWYKSDRRMNHILMWPFCERRTKEPESLHEGFLKYLQKDFSNTMYVSGVKIRYQTSWYQIRDTNRETNTQDSQDYIDYLQKPLEPWEIMWLLQV